MADTGFGCGAAREEQRWTMARAKQKKKKNRDLRRGDGSCPSLQEGRGKCIGLGSSTVGERGGWWSKPVAASRSRPKRRLAWVGRLALTHCSTWCVWSSECFEQSWACLFCRIGSWGRYDRDFRGGSDGEGPRCAATQWVICGEGQLDGLSDKWNGLARALERVPDAGEEEKQCS